MANTYIGGSTKIGEKERIAPSTSFRDRIVTGRDSKVGLGSVVTKKFEKQTWIGSPEKLMTSKVLRELAKFK